MGIGKQWEGEVEGFPLRSYLGGSETSDVFLTEYQGQKAAIKLVPADAKSAEVYLARWQSALKLSHSHLVRLFQTGRGNIAGTALVYVVMEYADEVLSEALAERPLTTTETREMLDPVLSVLAYLHRAGFVHGHVKPSNITAVNDHLKISSDGISRIGESGQDPAGDVWSLGLTIIEVMTQRREAIVPATLPQPFLDIARGALNPNPEKRWSVAKIEARLRGTSPPWRIIVPAAAVGLAAIAIWLWPRSELQPALVETVPATSVQPEQKAPPPKPVEVAAPPPKREVKKQPEEKKAPPVEREPAAPAETIQPSDPRIVREVLPEILEKARKTIHGRAMVSVSVRVDPQGNVAEAKLGSVGKSKYFERQALKAAQQWKFQPADGDQNWILRFEFTRTETKVVPVRVGA